MKDQLLEALARKKLVILYGSGATGKTKLALDVSCQLASENLYNLPFEQLSFSQKSSIYRDSYSGLVRMCSFHPSFDYISFVEGYRPEIQLGQEVHLLRDGIFKKLCKEALARPEHGFYLIIEHIQQGNVQKIFGEIISILEVDKRGKRLVLATSGESFFVPENVYIIATMTGHPSQLDPAFFRRFACLNVQPNMTPLENTVFFDLNLADWLTQINLNIKKELKLKGRYLQVGQGYYMSHSEPVTSLQEWLTITLESVIPYIETICEFEESKIQAILGATIMNWYKEEYKISQEDLIKQMLLEQKGS